MTLFSNVFSGPSSLSSCKISEYAKTFVLDRSKIVVQIADNGDGIEDIMLDQIFASFFTTKKEGSGIGLSLGRQIILLHLESINVNSQFGKGTVFTIKL